MFILVEKQKFGNPSSSEGWYLAREFTTVVTSGELRTD